MSKTLPVVILKGIVLLPNNEIRIDLDNNFKHILNKSLNNYDGEINIKFLLYKPNFI